MYVLLSLVDKKHQSNNTSSFKTLWDINYLVIPTRGFWEPDKRKISLKEVSSSFLKF